MIFAYRNDGVLGVIPMDFLSATALLYLLSGSAYFWALGVDLPVEVLASLSAVFLSMLFFRRGVVWLDCGFSMITCRNIFLLSMVGAFVFLAFLIFSGKSYFFADKVSRSSHIAEWFFLRIPLYVAYVFSIILQFSPLRFFLRFLLLALLSLVTLVEMNREFLIVLSIGWAALLWRDFRCKVVPPGLVGGFVVVLGLVFVLILAKPLMYILILGQQYDGGFLNFGETVNWARWFLYAQQNSVDLSSVQSQDLRYGLFAILLPYSPVSSSSAVWFSEVLMESDVGRTFGYSGILWLSHWFPGVFVAAPILILFWLYSRASGNHPLLVFLGVSLCLVSFRFWRSEWVLVEKTLLWTYFYPVALAWIVARLRLK